MAKLPLTISSGNDNITYVQKNGEWVSLAQINKHEQGIATVDPATGLLQTSQIPSTIPAKAIVKPWAAGNAYLKDEMVYQRFSATVPGGLYTATRDIPAGTNWAKADWVWAAVDDAHVEDWEVFNPALDKPIAEGSLFYYKGSLYRSKQYNIGADITSGSFEKVAGSNSILGFDSTMQYKLGDVINYQGHLATPVANFTAAQSQFAWGTSGNKFKPVFPTSGTRTFTWKGPAPGVSLIYQRNDVITIGGIGTGIDLYVCNVNGALFDGVNGRPNPSEWGILDNGIVLPLSYPNISVNIPMHATANLYYKDDVVMTTAGKLYAANGTVYADTLFAEGTVGATWRQIGYNNAVVPWVQASDYKALALVKYTDSDIYIANSVIPANTAFVEGTTGATWKKISSTTGVASDVNFINSNISNNNTIGAVQPMTASSVRGMTMTGGGFDLKNGQTYLITVGVNSSGLSTDAQFKFSTNSTTGITGMIGPAISVVSASYNTTASGLDSITFVYSPTANETIYLKRTGGSMPVDGMSHASVIQISGTNGTLPVFQGATNLTDGKAGIIAAPVAGAEKKILFGDGEWKDPAELLSSEIPYVCGSISDITAGSQTSGTTVPIYKTKNYGIDCVNNKLQLKANQTYVITTSIHMSGANYGAFRWYNDQTSSYVDQGELLIADASTNGQATGGQGGTFIYTPPTNCDLRLVRSRSQIYPGTTNGYSQWTCIRISGTAGSFPIFEGSTATVQGKAGALAAAPLNTQDYVLYGSGEWKPLNAASSTNVVTKSQNPAANGTLGGNNIFVDRQSRVNVAGVLSTVRIPNYTIPGAVIVLRPQAGDASFNAGGKWDLVGTAPFAVGATTVSPGIPVSIGDIVGVWLSGTGSVNGTYSANGPTNNLIWITTAVMPTLPATFTTGGGNALGLASIGFDITTLSAGSQPTYVSPKMAMGSFSNSGSSTGFTGVITTTWDNIGVTGSGTTQFTVPNGEYLLECQVAMTGGSSGNAYYSWNASALSNTTANITNGIALFTQTSSWNEGDASVSTAILKPVSTGNMSFRIDIAVGNGASATVANSRSWWKLTKLA